ncbi:transcriptional regulator, TetR family [Desulfarculus baarsii DSM 2075]|uniref:Transcriptional regulator, TetR family n=1 Tax=Desulfarculus baarsii (strain ATCC 33931 / DSM 2075 / LMG 7858 / VKM B-1802 / 2st14) TaxID=644282 RepID=E1QJ01_DESB2|nr:TetR/AcrR family transcriptional regulator [Desulfarculus baarsii]ADK85544.1 transcriptional regulator, TetR family [Desulfarculus baarsii DSM 2075]
MSANVNQPDPTRERLLLEAERLFATKGYAAVSVRQITAAAETNSAAINYHFGGKKNLYLEVFRQRWLPRAHSTMAKITPLLEADDLSVEKVIRTAIDVLWKGPLSHDSQEFFLHGALIHRELHNRTEAWDILVEEAIVPFYDLLYRIFLRIDPTVQKAKVMLNCMSMFSQLVFFSHARPIAQQVMGQPPPEDVEAILADHITAFCLHGMNQTGDQP